MSDEHGPRAGCNWNKCGFDDPAIAALCPFVKDDRPVPIVSVNTPRSHEHEWRQRWVVEHNTTNGDPVALPDGFYCVHCLTVTENRLEHNSVIEPIKILHNICPTEAEE